jgi:hypothetical protein
MRTTPRRGVFRTVSISLALIGVIFFLSGQAFYAFCFLPNYHGGFTESVKEGFFDWSGWWAFSKSRPGWIFRGCAVLH